MTTEGMSWEERREEAIDLMDGGLGVEITFSTDSRPEVQLSRWNWAPMQRLRVRDTLLLMLTKSLLFLEPRGCSGTYYVSEVRR